MQSEQGYLNLMRLVSRAHLEFKTGSTAALPLDDLVGYTDGLLAFTGSAGSMLGRLLGGGQGATAEHHLERLQRMFDGRLYFELQRHGEDNERRIEGPLLDLAYAKGLPIVGTNDVHFPKEAMYEAHDVLLCIEQGVHIEDPNRRRLTPEHYFKSAAQMRAGLRRPARSLRQHSRHRAALRLHAGAAQAHPAELHQAPGPLGGGSAARPRADRAGRAAGPSAGWPTASSSTRTRNGSSTSST